MSPLLLALLVGCIGSTRPLLVEADEDRSVVHIPRGDRAPVEVGEDAFAGAVATLAPMVQSFSEPLLEARRLLIVPSRNDSYPGARGHLGLVSLGTSEDVPQEHLLPEPPGLDAVTHGYGLWCHGRSRPPDCLHLIEGGLTLGHDGKRALAMHFAVASLWEETKGALGEMVDPVAIQASIVSAMTMYLMLWVLPEPVSKGLAAALTVALIGYLGVDTVWSLIQGWVRLEEEVEKATTFEQVRASGERFRKVLGVNSARIFFMLAAAAIGNTAAGFASKLPALPGAAQAALLAETQGGLQLSLVAVVDTVTISAEGATVVLAPGAVAMSSQGASGGSNSTSGDTTVYISRNSSGQVQYAGITNEFARRMAEHLRINGFRIVQLMKGLSREDARAVEQVLIELHGLQKNGGALLNRINSVARTNPKYADMLRRGKELLESIDYKAD